MLEPAPGLAGFLAGGAVQRPGSAAEDGSLACPAENISAELVRRLRVSAGISDEDIETIRALPITVKEYAADRAVVRDGQRATECCLIAEGFCARSKTTSEGKRQILSIHIPGEIPDLMSLFLHVMDHDLSTLTPCTLGFIDA